MTKKITFKKLASQPVVPADPERLFDSLRDKDPEFEYLRAHQADLLRSYYPKCSEKQDVAIELPTGAGKTLVGLLIAEWRRQSCNSRVAYLCPNIQLAYQVGEQAKRYGIRAHVLTGKGHEYDRQHLSEYKSNRTIAITTYSGVFNTRPTINDAQTLILDDAHAGEDPMVDMWSVEIKYSDIPNIYLTIVGLLKDELNLGFYSDISTRSNQNFSKASVIELASSTSIRKYAHTIKETLDRDLENNTSPGHSWSLVRNNLAACNFFISWGSILIRPYIPPTLTHQPLCTGKSEGLYVSYIRSRWEIGTYYRCEVYRPLASTIRMGET